MRELRNQRSEVRILSGVLKSRRKAALFIELLLCPLFRYFMDLFFFRFHEQLKNNYSERSQVLAVADGIAEHRFRKSCTAILFVSSLRSLCC
jgi:hypothetical protein